MIHQKKPMNRFAIGVPACNTLMNQGAMQSGLSVVLVINLNVAVLRDGLSGSCTTSKKFLRPLCLSDEQEEGRYQTGWHGEADEY